MSDSASRAETDGALTHWRPLLAEFVGTAFLLAAVVGSGIMAEQLTDDVALQLLCNAIATGGALGALITSLGPVSGAHFNPVVSGVATLRGELNPGRLPGYIAAQVAGAALGVVLANVMFELDAVSWSTKDRIGSGTWVAEVVATVGLLMVIWGSTTARRDDQVAWVVAAYITGAYWFTASTSFANPAVTLARTLSDSFAGIAPGSVPGFLSAQLVGAGLGAVLLKALFSTGSSTGSSSGEPTAD